MSGTVFAFEERQQGDFSGPVFQKFGRPPLTEKLARSYSARTFGVSASALNLETAPSQK
ncbi:hypothetical protein WG901_21365 [Novosphingobium sp. PS1R-30]|uniref:Uncharacterized protein n=1 Tax=Novosphingobium anseongense TaxID=3133436 RepID=A0ABU8S1I5_9SPHN